MDQTLPYQITIPLGPAPPDETQYTRWEFWGALQVTVTFFFSQCLGLLPQMANFIHDVCPGC